MEYGSVVIMKTDDGQRITEADDFIEVAAEILALDSPVTGVRTVITFSGANGKVSYELQRFDREHGTYSARLVEDHRAPNL